MNTSTLISIISDAAHIARGLDVLHGQGISYGPLIPSRLAADGSLLSPIPLISSDGIDLTRMAHSPQETLSHNTAPSTASDLYSLGVVLYRQLVGQLPFYDPDPLALVHQIFTAQPQPPHEINADIPVPLSVLTMELLAKSADERPRSAGEIAAILESFAERLKKGTALPEFAARKKENRLKAGTGLFGRDAEIAMISSMIEESKEGRAILAMITGPSGIGKSALTFSAKPLVAQHNGLFAVGKYDQFQRNIPYSAIIEVFRDLFLQLLSLTTDELERWRQDLLAALGEEGKVVSDVIPEILHIIGPQPDVPVLSGMASQLRFNGIFSQLVGVFARPEHPLVIFLDDLQWVDAASLAFIEATGVRQTGNALLLLGAYRDNEVSETHPLLHTLGTLKKAEIDSRQLTLAPLEDSDVHKIVLEACEHRILDSRELSARIMKETGGNPFFTHQYLEELYNDGRLHFNSDLSSWMWIKSDGAQPQTADVMELMHRRLARHSETTCNFLHLGACLGAKFRLAQLVKITGFEDYEVLAALQPAVVSGLVLNADQTAELNVRFAFLHDRVQQAAYGLKTAEENTAAHLYMAQKLRHGLDDHELDLQLFEIVDQFNQGLALVRSEEERLELAGLNRLAGMKAYEALAFAASISYFDTALSILGEEGWQDHHELCFAIGLLNLESSYQLPGSGFEAFADTLESHATTRIEVVKVDVHRIRQLTRASEMMEALEQARVSLERLEITIPSTTANIDTLKQFCMAEVARFKECMQSRTAEELYTLPDARDERVRLALDVITETIAAAIGFDFFYFTATHCLGATLSIQHGLSPNSALIIPSAGTGLIVLEEDYAGAKRLNQFAEKLVKKRYNDSTLLQVCRTGGYFLSIHWTAPLPVVRTLAIENSELAAKLHDPLYTAWNLFAATLMSLSHCSNLVQIMEDAQNLYRFSATNQFAHTMQAGQLFGKTAALFTSHTRVPDSLSDAEFNEESFIATWQTMMPLWVGLLFIGRAFLHVFARNPEKALEAVTASHGHYPPSYPMNDVMRLWTALAWHALARTGSPEQKAGALAEIQRSLDFLQKVYADGGEFNVGHRIAAIEALQADMAGESTNAKLHYEKALSLATANEFNMECGLFAEIASECFVDTDRPFALQCLRQARKAYAEAGALALVKRVEDSSLYTDILEADARQDMLMNLDEIDSMTVTRAVMTISKEVELTTLLPKLLQIILEHSGAERACLASRKDGKIRIEQVAGQMTPDSPVPEGLFNFVINTGESIYFDDIGSKGFPTDPYFESGKIKSVACRVLDRERSANLLLYLENNALIGVFSESRRNVLNWIISQAVVSIENAELYAGLESKVAERTAKLEAANAELEVSKEKADTANKAKSEFLANMSHEIRTPMNAVLGFSEVLEDLETDPDKLHYLDNIRTSGKSLLNLINQVLDFSKIEAGKMELEYSAVSVPTLFREMNTIFGQKITGRGLGFELTCESSVPNALILDEVRLRQVLINLIGNAVKFTETGKISVRATAVESDSQSQSRVELTIEVEDTGVGVPNSQKDKIFGAFEQVEGQKTAVYGGTGLGLTITHRLVTMMQGEIGVYGEEGQGAIFKVKLPNVEIAALESLDADAKSSLDLKTVSFEPATILITDDVDYNREMVTLYLAPFNFSFLYAANGLEAIEQARKHHPDVILMDIKMPKLNGYEASKQLKADEALKTIPIIVVTASALEQDEAMISKLCDGYLRKPVSRVDMVRELMRYLPHEMSGAEPEPAFNEKTADGPIIIPPEAELKKLYHLAMVGDLRELSRFAQTLSVNDESLHPYVNKLQQLAVKFRDSDILTLLRENMKDTA